MLWVLLPVAFAVTVRGETLAPGVEFTPGPVNSVRITRDGHTLLIYGGRPGAVDRVLFTHHRRDVAAAGVAAVNAGAEAIVPAAEERYFTQVGDFWSSFLTGRFHDYKAQTSKVLAEPFRSVTPVRGGQRLDWRGVEIEAIDTPGFTPGAVSYLIGIDGRRFAATGDLMSGDGKLLDLYSLQDAVPGTNVRGYHGYAARAGALLDSLRRVVGRGPEALLPSRGEIVRHPRASLDTLGRRLQSHLRDYFAADALRWYWGDENLRARAKGVLGDAPLAWMPMAEQMPESEGRWIIPIRTSRLLVSESGAALLIDCGYQQVIDEVKKLQSEGRFRKLEEIYVTHYHDDHTDFVEKAAGEFGVPVRFAPPLREVLEQPGAFRLPALTANPVRSSEPWEEGLKRRWHEFDLTSFFFPGQTLYHGALLVEKRGGPRVLFAGDSFTPSGIDDYCLWNRNLLGPDQGYFYCLRKLRDWGRDLWIVNEHVDRPFRFTADQVEYMRSSLARRTSVLLELTPFDSPNFAVDEQWARFFPYSQQVQSGDAFDLAVRVVNHSPVSRTATVTLQLPAGWGPALKPSSRTLKPGEEFSFRFRTRAGRQGLAVITADVKLGEWTFLQWTESLIEVRSRN